VKSGVGNEVRLADKERKAFEQEKKYWIDRLAPAGKSPTSSK
jgi:hypothetical protein